MDGRRRGSGPTLQLGGPSAHDAHQAKSKSTTPKSGGTLDGNSATAAVRVRASEAAKGRGSCGTPKPTGHRKDSAGAAGGTSGGGPAKGRSADGRKAGGSRCAVAGSPSHRR